MRGHHLWGFSQVLFCGYVLGIREPVDCAAIVSTKTIYLPTTIYTPAPSGEGEGSNGSRQDYCSISSFPGDANSGTSLASTEATGASSIPTTAVGSGYSTGDISSTAVSSVTTGVVISNTTSFPIPGTSASPSTQAPPRPTDPFGITPPSPPGPFRGFKNAVYFTNWGTYTSGYQPQELPVSELTHIIYAFADIDVNGTVRSSDPAVDLEKRYPLDSTNNFTTNAYGVVKQLFIHKKHNRHLKTLLSIGGWNYSPKFASAAATEMGRQTFAKSAVQIVTDWGFDGIDVDWEFPSTDVEKENFVKLLEVCRSAFDRYSFQHHLGYRFEISVASPASPLNYQNMDLATMNRYVDTWHLMAYDYSGSWDTVSGHQANVFVNRNNAVSTKLSTHDAIGHYEEQGIHPQKILMGLPLYGRAFEGTSGLGQNYSGVGEGGPQPGIYYYRDLPRPGAAVLYDEAAKATYSYDNSTRELISYDDVRSTRFKSRYVVDRHLGGAFFWEASGDKAGARSLVGTMSEGLRWLDETPNNLRYPTSRYRNIRLGIPGE
ncbi:glycoside hydrolase superfamily [Xylariaceae sp. FL0662B]|nr:glycoside hydrolase superfamily [Xylariaceae sp. FL0662B]